MKSWMHSSLYVQGPRNPLPTSMDMEILDAFIERRPYCNIRTRKLMVRNDC